MLEEHKRFPQTQGCYRGRVTGGTGLDWSWWVTFSLPPFREGHYELDKENGAAMPQSPCYVLREVREG